MTIKNTAASLIQACVGGSAPQLLVAFAIALPLSGAAINITNASFETDSSPSGGYVTNATGWTSTTLTGASSFHTDPSELASGPQNGVNVLALQAGSVYQMLSAVLTMNTLYTLQVGVGSRSDGPFIQSYAVDLEAANGDVLATLSSPIPANGTMLTTTLNYTVFPADVDLGQNLVIRLINTNPNSVGSQVLFDNVLLNGASTVTSPSVPEPSTVLLGALGVVFVIVNARLRKYR